MSKSSFQFYIIFAIFLLAIPIISPDTVTEDEVVFQPVSSIDSNSIELQGIGPDSFVSRWNTTHISSGSSNTTQIVLPLLDTGTYDFVVDWGDGTTDSIIGYDPSGVNHTYYNAPGVYQIVINGTIQGWRFNNGGDKLKIIEISQWGDFNFGNSFSYFRGASNLVLTATDAPNLMGTTMLTAAFRDCSSLGGQGSMDTWDVSSVTSMIDMFVNAVSFNQPLGNWNTSSVTLMPAMFYGASSFNQPIISWNTSSVTSMNSMFANAASFNQPLGNWDVSSATDMANMFDGVTLYYQYYDHLLIGWSSLPSVQSGVIFDAGDSYIASAAATDGYVMLSLDDSWVITHGGLHVPSYPDLSNPEHIEYLEGETGNEIVWDVGDKNPDYYNISKDGALIDEGVWTNGSIVVDVDGLSEGIYDYEITLFDIYGTTVSDLVVVDIDLIDTVTETETETTTDTETETATETETEDGINTTITDTVTDTDLISSILTEYITSIPSDLTDTTDTPIYFTFVIMGLVVFVMRRRYYIKSR